MPAAYSLDLRTRVLHDCDHGMSSEDAARKYSVSITWVYNLKKRRKETGSIAPKKYQPGPKRKLAAYEQEVRQLVADHPDATLFELHALLPNKEQVNINTLHNYLRHLKITWKKNAFRCRTTSTRRYKKRDEWKQQQESFDIEHFVLNDETRAKTNIIFRYGRADRGKRLFTL